MRIPPSTVVSQSPLNLWTLLMVSSTLIVQLFSMVYALLMSAAPSRYRMRSKIDR
ncbi:hypothetical protein BYT27DRAFT_7196018 [Phlegmacium glaucopus]|nr:hypothetical protein BYT27DRAFT_7196018 [Phlegmacium glaucopus]